MARLPQVASRVDASATGGNAVRAPAIAPAHEPKFSEATLLDPKTHAAQLTKTLRSLLDATRAARSHPRNRSTTFEGVALPGSGGTVTLKHGFGQTRVRYAIVRWISTAGGVAPVVEVNAATTANALALTSQVAGTADIEVWAQS